MGLIIIVITGNGICQKLDNSVFQSCFKYLLCSFIWEKFRRWGSLRDDAEVPLGKGILGPGWCSEGLWSPGPSPIAQGGLGGGAPGWQKNLFAPFFLCGDLN